MAGFLKTRSWRWLFLLVPVLLLFGFLLWAGSESALQWATQRAVSLTDGKLSVHAVSGSLLGTMQAEKIEFETEEKRTELNRILISWSPWALLSGHIRVHRLTADAVRVINKKPSTTPPTLPESLQLPLRLSVAAIQVKALSVGDAQQPQALGSISATLRQQRDTYTIQLTQWRTPWGQGQGETTLGAQPPFTIMGKFAFSHAKGQRHLDVNSALTGTLSELKLATSASGTAQAQLTALLTPFSDLPYKQLELKANDLNPARWNAAWPQAALQAELKLTADNATLQGELAVSNTDAGLLDKQRIPLKHLRAKFSGNIDIMSIDDLLVDLGAAGQLEGVGEYREQALALDLATQNLNPRGIHSTAEALRLAGSLHLVTQAERQAVGGELAQGGYRAQFDLTHAQGVIDLKSATLQAKGGALTMTGSLNLAGPRRFQAEAQLRAFNPAAFGDYPQANIHAQFQAQGQLTPQWQAALQFDIAQSQYQRHALKGKGKFNLAPQRIWDSDVDLKVANNVLNAQGSFGAAGDQLTLDLSAQDLRILGSDFGGQLAAKGVLSGTLKAPAGQLRVRAQDVRWTKAYRVQRFEADARVAQGLAGQMAVTASWEGLQAQEMVWAQGRIQAHGLRQRHSVDLAAKHSKLDVTAALRGGWDEKTGWTGTLAQFENRGPYAARLQAPAQVRVAADKILLSDARLTIAQGEIMLQQVHYQDGMLSSSGSLQGIAVDTYRNLLPQNDLYQTNVVLGGQWQLELKDKANGRIELRRERGDVMLRTAPTTALGLRQARLQADIKDNRMNATLEMRGDKLGQLQAQAQTQLSRRTARWGVAGDAPLQAKLEASMPALAWLAPLLDRTGNLQLDGLLSANLNASGTISQPRLAGRIDGTQLKVEVPEHGVYFKDGKLNARVTEQAIVIESVSLQSGKGPLTGQGRIDFADESATLKLRADRFEVLARPGRHLIVSGEGTAALAQRKAQIQAQLRAEEGRIELPKFDAPTLSDDVVVLGRKEKPESKGVPYAIQAQLDIDLGSQFILKAMGLDAQLGGGVKLNLDAGQAPRANGSIRIIKGGYSAYGQRLDIERGILNFQGPLDNPGLNILALRKSLPVEAGVAVTGTALAPKVQLASRPTVPDSEKLSWLVLGHGASSANSSEVAALQTAASALLSAGESVTLQSRVAQAAGLDEVNLSGGGTLEETVLTLGKRLSDKTYLSFDQGLTGASNLVKVNHQLSKRLSVRVQTGTDSAADLFYTFSFD